jgi:hypothetical protein
LNITSQLQQAATAAIQALPDPYSGNESLTITMSEDVGTMEGNTQEEVTDLIHLFRNYFTQPLCGRYMSLATYRIVITNPSGIELSLPQNSDTVFETFYTQMTQAGFNIDQIDDTNFLIMNYNGVTIQPK